MTLANLVGVECSGSSSGARANQRAAALGTVNAKTTNINTKTRNFFMLCLQITITARCAFTEKCGEIANINYLGVFVCAVTHISGCLRSTASGLKVKGEELALCLNGITLANVFSLGVT